MLICRPHLCDFSPKWPASEVPVVTFPSWDGLSGWSPEVSGAKTGTWTVAHRGFRVAPLGPRKTRGSWDGVALVFVTQGFVARSGMFQGLQPSNSQRISIFPGHLAAKYSKTTGNSTIQATRSPRLTPL